MQVGCPQQRRSYVRAHPWRSAFRNDLAGAFGWRLASDVINPPALQLLVEELWYRLPQLTAIAIIASIQLALDPE